MQSIEPAPPAAHEARIVSGRQISSSWFSDPVREGAITLALLTLVLLASFWPVIFGGATLLPSDLNDTLTQPFSQYYGPPQSQNLYVSDGILQFYPYKTLLREAWQHGRFAFWNPLNVCGYPQYAESMATNLDVLNVILLAGPFPLFLHLYLLAPLLIAGLALYLLLGLFVRDYWIRRIFATGYMLCGIFITHLIPHFIPGSFCWTPLILFGLERYFRAVEAQNAPAPHTDKIWLLLSGVALALGFLGGNIQTASFLGFSLVIYAACRGYQQSRGRAKRLLTATLLPVTVGFGLSAIMWAPTLEFVYQVVRYGAIMSSSLTRPYTLLERLATVPMMLAFFLPQLGSVPNGFSIYNAISIYTIDFNMSIGFFPLLFGVWALVRLRRERAVMPFVWLAVLSLGLPLLTPLFHFLYHRFFVIAILSLSIGGAIGLEAAVDGRVSARRLLSVAGVVTLVLAAQVIAVGILILVRYDALRSRLLHYVTDRSYGMSFADGNEQWLRSRVDATLAHYSITDPWLIALLASIALGFWLLRRALLISDTPRGSFRRTPILIGLWAITAFQVGSFAFTWLPHVDTTRFPLVPRSQLTSYLQSHLGGPLGDRLYVMRALRRGEQYIMLDNMNTMYGIPEVSGFESFLPRSFYLALPAIVSDSNPHPKFLGLLNVGYAVNGGSGWHDPALRELTVGAPGASPHLYENADVQPRAWIAFETARVPSDSEALRELADSGFDPVRLLLPEDSKAPLLSSGSNTSNSTPAECAITAEAPESLRLRTRASRSAYLVLSDTYYPGWRATVDGKPAEIYRANYAMRAVYLPAGEHSIEMTFEPLSFRLGAWVSVISVVLVTIALSLLLRRKRAG